MFRFCRLPQFQPRLSSGRIADIPPRPVRLGALITLWGICTGVQLIAQNPLYVPPVLTGPSIDLNMQIGTTEFTAGVQTTTYGYNASFLGPTLILQNGEDVVLNVTNNLGEETTTHWHGMHVSPENDGGPHTTILDGETWSPAFTVLDSASTMWYHPHLHEHTNEQVTYGLAGMILVRDAFETAADLPRTYGVDEFPIFLLDRNVGGDGQFQVAGLGNTILINGTPDAFLEAPAQMVRFRLVNASTERGYNVGLSNGMSFSLVGTDGGLLAAPLTMTRMLLMPGERVDLVADLSSLNGSTVNLVAYNSEITGNDVPGSPNGPGDSPLDGLDLTLVELRVGAPTASAVTTLPTSIWTPPSYAEAAATTTRQVRMTTAGPGAPFLLDGGVFDHQLVNHTVNLNAVEIWEIINETNFAHPFHIHDVQFRILDIGGVAPPAEFAGLKDTVLVREFTTVRFIAKFEDFANDVVPYMYHCHVLTHEDGGMMGQFRVTGEEETTTEVTPISFPGAARVVNLSTRARIGGGAGTPVAGFVLDGAGSKRVAVRAVGPGLSSFGVTDVLPDPSLELISDGSTVTSNDSWTSTDADVFASVGAFALLANSADAALVTNLTAGVYTTPVGDGGGDGVMLLEVYDSDGLTDGAALANASARTFVGTGEDVISTGFVVAGTGMVRILIRAVGPTLTDYGVAGALADPTLSLVTDGNELATNDNWGAATNAADIASAAAASGAFALDNASLDAAILIELPAGVYSAVISGTGATTGTALIELYRIRD